MLVKVAGHLDGFAIQFAAFQRDALDVDLARIVDEESVLLQVSLFGASTGADGVRRHIAVGEVSDFDGPPRSPAVTRLGFQPVDYLSAVVFLRHSVGVEASHY